MVPDGKDLLLTIDDGTGTFVEVSNQGAGTYKPGKSAGVTVHKNGQTPHQSRAGESYETDFMSRRPMLADHQRIRDLAASGEIVAVVIADTNTGGDVYTGNAMLTEGDSVTGVDGAITYPLTVTFDGPVTRSVTA